MQLPTLTSDSPQFPWSLSPLSALDIWRVLTNCSVNGAYYEPRCKVSQLKTLENVYGEVAVNNAYQELLASSSMFPHSTWSPWASWSPRPSPSTDTPWWATSTKPWNPFSTTTRSPGELQGQHWSDNLGVSPVVLTVIIVLILVAVSLSTACYLKYERRRRRGAARRGAARRGAAGGSVARRRSFVQPVVESFPQTIVQPNAQPVPQLFQQPNTHQFQLPVASEGIGNHWPVLSPPSYEAACAAGAVNPGVFVIPIPGEALPATGEAPPPYESLASASTAADDKIVG